MTAAVAVLSAALAPVTAVAQDGTPFSDVPYDAYFAVPVGWLAETGVVATNTLCDDATWRFCPAEPIDRKTMAVWTVRVLDGQDPAPVSSTRFEDVDVGSFYAPFIERMAELGVSQGCGDGSAFCPDRNVTRAQMAAFLSRAYSLPAGPDPNFSDVPDDAWYATDVAKLAASGITAGCGDGTVFCPSRDTTRAQMATFLYRATARQEGQQQEAEETLVDVADAEAYMVQLVNQLRAGLNISPLEQHDDVAAVARRWSNTMHENDDFKHNPRYSAEYPAGRVTGGENIARVGYYGDLIAAVDTAFDLLSDSPGHHRNMIRASFGQIGVGLAVGRGYVWVTQNFACYPRADNSSCDPASRYSDDDITTETIKPESEFWERDSRCDDDTDDEKYTSVVVSREVLYALRLDGTIACFGFAWGTPQVPSGSYTSISVGRDHVCALRTDDRIACWAKSPGRGEPYVRNRIPAATNPAGTFLEVSAGWLHSCGLRTDQSIVCWGRGPVTDPPEGAFSSISVDRVHACALTVEGTVVCWGDRVSDVLTGRDHGNPLVADIASGDVGVVTNDAVKRPPGGLFSYISTGTMHACGLRLDGSTECWGQLAVATPEAQFTQISVGTIASGDRIASAGTSWSPPWVLACGVDADHRIVCWGHHSSHWRSRESSHVLQDVASLANNGDCFIRGDGTARCEDIYRGPGTRIDHPGIYIDAYSKTIFRQPLTCLLNSEGVISCSGARHREFVDNVPTGTFTEMSIHSNLDVASGCVIRISGTLACWGGWDHDRDFVDETPSGMFTLVDVSGDFHACALSVAGNIECWGNIKIDYVNTLPDESQAFPVPPEGVFVDVSVSENGACAVRLQGSVICWSEGYFANDYSRYEEEGFGYYVAGDPSNGLTNSAWSRVVAETPAGQFTSVSRTDKFVCGLRRDGSMACWGDPGEIPPHPPQGPFVEIEGTCGRRQEGTVDCYGWRLPAGVSWINPFDGVEG